MKRTTFLLATLLACVTVNSYGQFWQQTNGLPGNNIVSGDVGAQGTIYILTKALHRSTDKGMSWSQIDRAFAPGTFTKIFALPNGRLVAKTIEADFTPGYGSYYQTLLYSDNDGEAWYVGRRYIKDVWKGVNGELFITDSSTGILISNDEGNSWQILSKNGVMGVIKNITSDYKKNFFVSADYSYRSSDKGNNWSKIVNGVSKSLISISASLNGDLYGVIEEQSPSFDPVTFARSKDQGRTWQKVETGLPSSYYLPSFPILILDSNHIAYSSAQDIVYSKDKGNSWLKTNNPNYYSGYFDNVFRESDSTFLLSFIAPTNNTRLIRFSVLDTTFVEVFFPGATVSSLIAHPNGHLIGFSKLQPTHDYPYTQTTAYPWLSTDNGVTWRRGRTDSATILIYNSQRQLLCTALDSNYNILVGGVQGQLCRSTDAGLTWRNPDQVITYSIVSGIAVQNNGDIYFTCSPEGVFRSTDNGDTWDQMNNGIVDQKLYAVAVHQNGEVYVASTNSIYRSTDKGQSWTLTTDTATFPRGSGPITSLVVSIQGNILAGIDKGGVYWSTDNGATWTERAAGLKGTKIYNLLSTPSGKVFASTDSGVYLLDTTSSSTWQNHSAGLTSMNILSLCRNSEGRLFAGTEASGVFSSLQTFNIISPEAVKQTGSTAKQSSLGVVYPNPSSSKVTIPFSVSERTQVEITVVDILGNTLGIIENEVLDKGTYETSLTTSELPNGTYTILMKAGDASFTKQFVVAK